jgi:predicted nuclease of predicted toxin-antitoxin system
LGLPLYADECVDARIVAGLRRRGADILTAADAGLLGQADERHLERAQALGRVILSGDQDFLLIAHRCASRAIPFPGLIFIQPKSAVGEVIRAVVLLTDLLSSKDMAGWIEWVP